MVQRRNKLQLLILPLILSDSEVNMRMTITIPDALIKDLLRYSDTIKMTEAVNVENLDVFSLRN